MFKYSEYEQIKEASVLSVATRQFLKAVQNVKDRAKLENELLKLIKNHFDAITRTIKIADSKDEARDVFFKGTQTLESILSILIPEVIKNELQALKNLAESRLELYEGTILKTFKNIFKSFFSKEDIRTKANNLKAEAEKLEQLAQKEDLLKFKTTLINQLNKHFEILSKSIKDVDDSIIKDTLKKLKDNAEELEKKIPEAEKKGNDTAENVIAGSSEILGNDDNEKEISQNISAKKSKPKTTTKTKKENTMKESISLIKECYLVNDDFIKFKS